MYITGHITKRVMEPGKWLSRPLFMPNDVVEIVNPASGSGFIVRRMGEQGVHHIPNNSVKIIGAVNAQEICV